MAVEADTMLAGGTVITVDGERRIFRDGAVACQGSNIVAVGKRAELERSVNARKVMDCRRRLIMPGFVNSHLHFYHTMHRGLAPEDLGGWLWSDYVHRRIATILTAEDARFTAVLPFCSRRSSRARRPSWKPARTIRAR